jgi:Domain of unknown function (DUF4249)
LGTRLAFLVLAAATACIETTSLEPDANTLVVHAVLDPGVQHQLIVVQTTTGELAAQRQVTGAVVTIATPDGRTLTAVERRDTAAVTGNGTPERFVPFPRVTTIYDLDVGGAGLIPGGTYQLRVVAPDGRTVTGRTTIPNAVPSTSAAPTQTFDRTRDTVSLQWSRVAGARSYQVFVRSTAGSYSLFADTSVVLPGNAQRLDNGEDVFERRLAHQLAVIAVDENYFDYYRSTSDLFTATGLIMHLHGGIGVFGSVVTVATRTIVVQ